MLLGRAHRSQPAPLTLRDNAGLYNVLLHRREQREVVASTRTMHETAAQRKEATRERLFRATLEVALERGLGNVSTHRVAAAAGMSTGAIYGNFQDREHLLREAMDYYRKHVADFDLSSARSLREWAHHYVDAYVELSASPDTFVQQTLHLQRQLLAIHDTDEAVREVVSEWTAARFIAMAEQIEGAAHRGNEKLRISPTILGQQLVMLVGWFSHANEVSDLIPRAVLNAGVDALVDNALAPARAAKR